MLQDYVNEINKITKSDSSIKANVFDPKINNSIITCYKIMDQYKNIKKKKDMPLPTHVALKKKGEHTTATFKFSPDVDAAALDVIIDDLQLINVTTDESDSGVVIKIEK